jgi:tetratricopeptide (TPR) repeat protein
VGSFKLDLGLVALYDRALTPDEIALHANPEADLEVNLIAALRRGDELLAAGRFDDARRKYAEIAGMADNGLFAPLVNYRVMARLRIADSFLTQERTPEARESYRAIADDEDVPGHYCMTAWLALADTYTRERNYSAARAEYERIAAATTGSREHYRVEALARAAEIETLADGAPLVGLRQRRLDRISHPAVTLYVATDGDDANPGTQEQPLATLGSRPGRCRRAGWR